LKKQRYCKKNILRG